MSFVSDVAANKDGIEAAEIVTTAPRVLHQTGTDVAVFIHRGRAALGFAEVNVRQMEDSHLMRLLHFARFRSSLTSIRGGFLGINKGVGPVFGVARRPRARLSARSQAIACSTSVSLVRRTAKAGLSQGVSACVHNTPNSVRRCWASGLASMMMVWRLSVPDCTATLSP